MKIFHTSNAVFKNLVQYIEGDPRFGGLRRRHRRFGRYMGQKRIQKFAQAIQVGIICAKASGSKQERLGYGLFGNIFSTIT